MYPITASDALVKQVATRAVSLLKLEWRGGDSAAGTGLFLQVHNSAVTPSAGAAPIGGCSWPLSTGAESYKEFKNGALDCPEGCFVGVSSTEATYTAATGNDKFANLRVELDEMQQPAAAALSTAGDLTTAVSGLSVWSEAAGASANKQLVTLEVDGTNLAAPAYIQLFAKDNPNDGEYPIAAWPIAMAQKFTKANGTPLNFGAGRDVKTIDATGTYKGCSVLISSTPKILTEIVSGSCRIKGWYK